ncbi:MAG: alpha/beta hydrolase [Pseudolabrys sp.]|nr:alpha/beta hydrolase [Pseudolabrys sp.]MDP2294731.1 alpha/beta hydrolase [Pseudolabrys sp.]
MVDLMSLDPSFLRRTVAVISIAVACLGALAIFTGFDVDKIERANPPSGRFVDVDGGRLHVVELGPTDAPPVVLLHGSSTNLGDMRLALGDRLAASYRVILIDRPGHGWSDRPNGRADASPAKQSKLIHQALERIGVVRPILVAHSWSGALAAAYALDYPRSVAGLVLLAPVTHPRPKSVAWYNSIIVALLTESARFGAAPIIGPMLARTFALPLGKFLIGLGVRSVFAPQQPPLDYLAQTGGELLLRPSEFVSNAQDLKAIWEFVEDEAPRYGSIETPTVILTGDADEVLSPEIQAKAMAAAVPRAKLIVLSGVGHMVQFAATERIVEIVAELSVATALPGGRTAQPGQQIGDSATGVGPMR